MEDFPTNEEVEHMNREMKKLTQDVMNGYNTDPLLGEISRNLILLLIAQYSNNWTN